MVRNVLQLMQKASMPMFLKAPAAVMMGQGQIYNSLKMGQ